MLDKINSFLNIFDIGDLKFFVLVGKKNIKNLILLSLIISTFVLLISLNLEKKFLSKATIVIEPEGWSQSVGVADNVIPMAVGSVISIIVAGIIQPLLSDPVIW